MPTSHATRTLLAILIAPLATWGALAESPPGEPTLEQTRQALLDLNNDGERTDKARRMLLESPSRIVLGHVRTIACSDQAGGLTFQILDVLTSLPEPASIELLIEILDGKTRLAPAVCWSLSGLAASRPHYAHLLSKSTAFRERAETLAGGPLRQTYIMLVDQFQWRDAADTLRALLGDPEYGIRVSAAKALRSLTGEATPLPEAPLQFPSVQMAPALFGHRHSLADARLGRVPRAASTLRWSDGARVLAITTMDGTYVLNEAFETLHVVETEDEQDCIHAVAGKNAHPVLLVLTSPVDGPAKIKRLDVHGNHRWTVEGVRDGFSAHAELVDSRGSFGIVALQRADGMSLNAWDGEGAAIWTAKLDLPGDLVLTHPRIPGLMVTPHGLNRFAIWSYDHTAARRQEVERLRLGLDYFCSQARLCCDGAGRGVLLLAGHTRPGSLPAVRGVDLATGRAWAAGIPGPCVGLTTYSPDAGPDVVVLATENDEILACTFRGVLIAREPLRDERSRASGRLVDVALGDVGRQALLLVLVFEESVSVIALDRDVLRKACAVQGAEQGRSTGE